MKKLVIILLIVIGAIKFVEPVNNWARGHLPEEILEIIGEKPKNLLEKVGDLVIPKS